MKYLTLLLLLSGCAHKPYFNDHAGPRFMSDLERGNLIPESAKPFERKK